MTTATTDDGMAEMLDAAKEGDVLTVTYEKDRMNKRNGTKTIETVIRVTDTEPQPKMGMSMSKPVVAAVKMDADGNPTNHMGQIGVSVMSSRINGEASRGYFPSNTISKIKRHAEDL